MIALQQTIGERVAETLQSMVEAPEAVREVTPRHHAAEPERRQLLGWIEESQTTVPEQLRQLTARLSRLKEEQHETEDERQHVPRLDLLAVHHFGQRHVAGSRNTATTESPSATS